MDFLEFVSHIAWPGTVLLGAYMFRDPLTDLIETIGRRAKSFQVYQAKIELDQLSKSFVPTVVIEQLASAPVGPSGLPNIAQVIRETAQSDSVVIDIGSAQKRTWLTSRLFIVAAAIERMRPTRSLVFVGEIAPGTISFIGAATPRDIRYTIGFRYPSYEKALVASLGALLLPATPGAIAPGNRPAEQFQGGLADELVDSLLNGFFGHQEIVISKGAGMVRQPRWVELEKAGLSTYEHADWISEALLNDTLIGRLSTGVVTRDGLSQESAAKAVVAQRGAFVANVDRNGSFLGLVDRYRVIEQVSAAAAELIEDAPPRQLRRGARKPPSAP